MSTELYSSEDFSLTRFAMNGGPGLQVTVNCEYIQLDAISVVDLAAQLDKIISDGDLGDLRDIKAARTKKIQGVIVDLEAEKDEI